MEVPARLTEEHLRLGYAPRRRSPLPNRLDLVETIKNWEVLSPRLITNTAEVSGVFSDPTLYKFWHQYEVIVISPEGLSGLYYRTKANGSAWQYEVDVHYDKDRQPQISVTAAVHQRTYSLRFDADEGALIYAAVTHTLAEEEPLDAVQPPRAAGMFATLDMMRQAAQKFAMMKDHGTILQVGMLSIRFQQPGEEEL